MRYRKMHAALAGEPLACGVQGLGETVEVSEARGLGGEEEKVPDDGTAGGGVVRVGEAPGREEKHDDLGSFWDETNLGVDFAGGFDAKGARFRESVMNGLLENWLMEINAPPRISINEVVGGSEFCSRVSSQDGKDEGNGVHLMVDLNGFVRDEKNRDGVAPEVDNGKEAVVRKARREVRSVAGFGVSDLVWGKVRSHPWWPGQIFDPSAASVKAEKHFKKNRFLIAYFGDQSFAWNEAMSIKPFEEHFSRMEKQSDSDIFRHALDCALEELSRRVEYGLACRCLPKEVYDRISTQTITNAGIKEEPVNTNLRDKYSIAGSLEPLRLVEYVKGLAQSPLAEVHRLELVVKQACLLAFSRWRGYNALPKFEMIDGLVEDGEHNNIASKEEQTRGEMMHSLIAPDASTDRKASINRKRGRGKDGDLDKFHPVSVDTLQPSKKQKSLSALMANKQLFSGKKRKARSSLPDDSATRGRGRQSKGSCGDSPRVKQSFKVGEKIRKISHELNGFSRTSCISRQSNFIGRLKPIIEQNSSNEMIAQLHSVAWNPTTCPIPLSPIISFFSEFRDFAISDRVPEDVTIKTSTSPVTGETLEYLKDSYWTDLNIQREEQTATEEGIMAENIHSEGVRDKKSDKEDNYTTALILNFTNLDSIPTEANLTKIFNSFGPLDASKTKVFGKSKRAKVVFKSRADAETAFSSAGKYSIFGPSLVSYSLKYEPSKPVDATAGTRK